MIVHCLPPSSARESIPMAIIFVTFQRYFARDADEGAERGESPL
jgi:hypothetical protein